MIVITKNNGIYSQTTYYTTLWFTTKRRKSSEVIHRSSNTAWTFLNRLISLLRLAQKVVDFFAKAHDFLPKLPDFSKHLLHFLPTYVDLEPTAPHIHRSHETVRHEKSLRCPNRRRRLHSTCKFGAKTYFKRAVMSFSTSAVSIFSSRSSHPKPR